MRWTNVYKSNGVRHHGAIWTSRWALVHGSKGLVKKGFTLLYRLGWKVKQSS